MKIVKFFIGFLLLNVIVGSSLFAQFNKSTRFTLKVKVAEDDSVKVFFHVNKKAIIDSTILYFFKENGYLRQPIVDSIRHNLDSMRLVLYPLLIHEVEIPISGLPSGTTLKRESICLAAFHKSDFKKLVTDIGGLDNITQLQTGFQLFIIIYFRKNNQVKIASNIFKL